MDPFVRSFNEDGEIIPNESKYVCDINLASLTPHVHMPQSTAQLKPLLVSVKKCFKHNYVPGIMIIGSGIMLLHYEAMLEHSEGSVPFSYGPSQKGKTQLSKILLYMLGMQKKAYKKTTSRSWTAVQCPLCHSWSMILAIWKIERELPLFLVISLILPMTYLIVDNLRTGAIWPRSTCVITENPLPVETSKNGDKLLNMHRV